MRIEGIREGYPLYSLPQNCYTDLREYNCDSDSGCQPISGVSPHFTAIVDVMPSQLFPLFKEVYGRDYPKDTPVILLGTETKPNNKQKLTKQELTEFVKEAILVLEKEMKEGYLTEQEYHDYVRLFILAADRALAKHPQLQEEVRHMTERWLKLPSEIRAELECENAEQRAEYRKEEHGVSREGCRNSASTSND